PRPPPRAPLFPYTTLFRSATKEFTLPVAGYEYGHGLGNIRGWGDGGATMELSYARVDGVDYGVRLDSLFDIRVGIEVVPDLLKGDRKSTRLNSSHVKTAYA